jgi:hypothetical protein
MDDEKIANRYARWYKTLTGCPKGPSTNSGIRTENIVNETIKNHEEQKLRDTHLHNKTPFTMSELMSALSNSKSNSAPGHDRITYTVLKSLSENFLSRLLALYNRSWTNNQVPKKWKQGLVAILAKTIDSTHPKEYRPITLLQL